uniref:G-protein coupled receptors family 1 profile domain-containing protein n=2 Tax=Ascaris lumbricoides TaxID=6252 RepID=A0A0M3IQ41_ASCLU
MTFESTVPEGNIGCVSKIVSLVQRSHIALLIVYFARIGRSVSRFLFALMAFISSTLSSASWRDSAHLLCLLAMSERSQEHYRIAAMGFYESLVCFVVPLICLCTFYEIKNS